MRAYHTGHTYAHGRSSIPYHGTGAIILPTVMEYSASGTSDKCSIVKTMRLEGVDAMSQEGDRKAAIDAVEKLSPDVGIPADVKEIVKKEALQILSRSAFADACRGGPRDTSVEEIKMLYERLL